MEDNLYSHNMLSKRRFMEVLRTILGDIQEVQSPVRKTPIDLHGRSRAYGFARVAREFDACSKSHIYGTFRTIHDDGEGTETAFASGNAVWTKKKTGEVGVINSKKILMR